MQDIGIEIPKSQACQALEITGGDIQAAINFLLG